MIIFVGQKKLVFYMYDVRAENVVMITLDR